MDYYDHKYKPRMELAGKATMLCVCLAGVIVWGMAFKGCAASVRPSEAQPVWDVNDLTLPAPSDIQKLLNRLEPEPRISVDGRIGPATMEKWRRVYIKVSAEQYFKGE